MPKFDLLTVSSAKSLKGLKFGYLNAALYLMPYKANSQGVNLCPKATKGCSSACLAWAGRIEMMPKAKNLIWKRRERLTEFLLKDREGFIAKLKHDIQHLINYCNSHELTPCVRLNGTSDLPFLPLTIAPLFPEVQFYDYTKMPVSPNDPRLKLPNYNLTFSRSENNWNSCLDALNIGINAAVVFSSRGYNDKLGEPKELPKTYKGFKVIDGDISDLRFLDHRGVIVGLRFKGKKHRRQLKNHIKQGFVVKAY